MSDTNRPDFVQHAAAHFAPLDFLPTGALVIDRHLTVLFWNRSLEGWTKLERCAIIGQPIDARFTTFRLPEYRRALQHIFAGSAPITFSATRHQHLITTSLPDGSQRVLRITATGVPFADEMLALLSLEDITALTRQNEEYRSMRDQARAEINARVNLEKHLKDAKEAAETASQAKTTFLASMSHELRTPMNAILGFTEILQHEPGLSARGRRHLAIIAQSGEHLMNLLNDVLEMSKIEAGKARLNLVSFDFHLMLATLRHLFTERAQQKGLNLIFEIDPDVPRYLHTDEAKLRQIIINLLSNAIKFTETGRVWLRVQVRATLPDHVLAFEVEDTGPGISPVEQHKLFQPFAQTHSGIRSQEGTGLGLAITRHYLELMHGKISLNSSEGQGSIFYFQVPVQRSDSTAMPPRLAGRHVVGMKPTRRPYRILVVDDRPESCLLVREWLEPLHFVVRDAGDGETALTLWQEWQPDLICLDMRLPVLDGYTVAQRIKATPAGAATPVIALTAGGMEHERAHIQAAGCDDVVLKPLQSITLFETLSRYLEIEFLYEETPSEPLLPSVTSSDIDLGLLAVLPADLRTALEQAAREVDLDRAEQVIEQMRAFNHEVASALRQLVHTYRFDRVRALLQEVRQTYD